VSALPAHPVPVHPRHRPRKRYGQHFLERAWVDKVIQAVAPSTEDLFLEIGPGRGAVTAPLAARAAHVVAIEIDRDLVEQLRSVSLPNLTVLSGDVLELTAADIARSLLPFHTQGIRVLGNLPYNIASPVLFRLVDLREGGLPIREAILMVQREVAERIVAPPRTRDYGLLSVQLGHIADVDLLLTLPPGAFRPPPKVHSALIRLRFHPPDPAVSDLAAMRALVRSLFTQRRKTLVNSLAATLRVARPSATAVIVRAGIDGSRRPETLTIAEFAHLSNVLQATEAANCSAGGV
jgi:16S rRNA (adenine1518-N6/adenine1519-N6)-dimethyltransferase